MTLWCCWNLCSSFWGLTEVNVLPETDPRSVKSFWLSAYLCAFYLITSNSAENSFSLYKTIMRNNLSPNIKLLKSFMCSWLKPAVCVRDCGGCNINTEQQQSSLVSIVHLHHCTPTSSVMGGANTISSWYWSKKKCRRER